MRSHQSGIQKSHANHRPGGHLSQLCAIGILFQLFCGQFHSAKGLHMAILTTIERTDIRSVVQLAIEQMQNEAVDPSVGTLTVSNYVVQKDNAGAAYQISDTICSEIAQDPSKHPDVIVDLSMFTENRCLFQYTARQIDAGIMTADKSECGNLEVENYNNPSDNSSMEITTLGVPSVRFPEASSTAALSAFASRLLTALHSDTVFFTDEILGPHLVFSDFEKLQFVGRYFIKLSRPTHATELIDLMEKIYRIVQSDLWIMKVSRDTMKTILNAIDQHDISSSMLNISWLIYDGSLNPNQCQLLCYTDESGVVRCDLQKISKEYLCIKLDLSNADMNALELVKRRVPNAWDNPNVDQVKPTLKPT
ncbi:unnamed protein product [Echinostoma caproni]|uniref:ANF_receptor domain-containing protein n=1 Tax=Echinostoma caproni TaxID=27848 RepID=A0A183AMA9_9TREM|nr:unnamed protein product [Echinostoma caproni]